MSSSDDDEGSFGDDASVISSDDGEAQTWIAESIDSGASGADLLQTLHAKGNLSVGRVQKELAVALEGINGATFELVREKYVDFVRVADSVGDCVLAVVPTRTALIRLHEAVSLTCVEGAAKRGTLEDSLNGRMDRRARARELGCVERFESELDRLEALIAEDRLEDAATIERSAHASLSLRAVLDRAVDHLKDGLSVARVHECASRVEKVERSTLVALEREFVRCCCDMRTAVYSDDAEVGCVVRAAAALGYGERLEDLYAERVVQGFVNVTLTTGRLDGGRRGSCEGLASIFDATLHFVRDRCGAVLIAAEKANGDSPGSLLAVDLLVRGVWRPIALAISTQLVSVFDLGIAERVHRTYSATVQFLDQLAAVVSTTPKRLRGSTEMLDLQAKWNLPVYLELIRTELTKKLEDSADRVGCSEFFHHGYLEECLAVVDQCWSQDVVLAPVAHSFFELSLDLVRAALRKVDDVITAATDDDDAGELWAGSVLSLARLRRDLAEILEPRLRTSLALATLLVEGCESAVFEATAEALKPIATLIRRLDERVFSRVLAQCDRRLRAVKSVTARYNLTNAPLPIAPSPYVSEALRPLRDFESLALPLLADSQWSRLHAAIAERYLGLVVEVRVHAAKFAETLRKRRQSSRTQLPAVDDTVKIDAQLAIDLGEIEAELVEAPPDTFGDLKIILTESTKAVTTLY